MEGLQRLLGRVRSKWTTFAYNYRWSDYVGVLNGWIPKVAVLVPLIGYAILFNDTVATFLSFDHLTERRVGPLGLTNAERLRCYYYGLLMLGGANLLYWWRRPFVMRLGNNELDYAERGFATFTLGDFISIHHYIREEGHTTRDGKYYDSEWDGFRSAASNEGEGTDQVQRTGNWEGAKSAYASLLRSMLRDHYASHIRSRPASLTIALLMAAIGYLLLVVPSVDLFLRITTAALWGGLPETSALN